MVLSSEQQRLLANFDAASRKMKEARPGDNASENEYSKAYQRLVKAGLALQIKKKYR